MTEPFIGTDIFHERIAAVCGKDGSVIIRQCYGDDPAGEEDQSISVSAESVPLLAAWLAKVKIGDAQ